MSKRSKFSSRKIKVRKIFSLRPKRKIISRDRRRDRRLNKISFRAIRPTPFTVRAPYKSKKIKPVSKSKTVFDTDLVKKLKKIDNLVTCRKNKAYRKGMLKKIAAQHAGSGSLSKWRKERAKNRRRIFTC